MAKIENNEIIYVIIGAFLSALFTWMFSTLTESLNPLIILYTIISALGTLILFLGIEKLLVFLYKKGIFWLEINKYNKKINQVAERFKKILLTKEIFIVNTRELGKYIDPKIQFYKPSNASIGFFNPGALKKSTIEVINKLINIGFLIYVESADLLLLKEKMKCVKCNGEIMFQDKIDFIDVKCKDCAEEYRIRHDGLWHVEKNKGISLYIGIKHLNKIRY